MQAESDLTTENLMTEVVQKGIATWDLNRGDAQCLSYASHILWNMDSIECCGMHFDRATIQQYFMDRFNPEYFQKTIEYVKAPPGSSRSHWVAAAFFMFPKCSNAQGANMFHSMDFDIPSQPPRSKTVLTSKRFRRYSVILLQKPR